ncbi:hypothetical protein Tco_1005194 [Tanacetum coccineum]|uniref:Uncharacterized protein n=1 Tax=Tanacetum coccineum TaxID=301880 RepID=A0ABQ5FEE4_9ASTR
MSSFPNSTITSSEFDMENAFSTMNIHNYTSASSATSGITSFNSSEDSRDGMIPPAFLLFYNNPYLKDVQAFYAKESPISPLVPIISPAMLPLSPIFNSQEFFVPEKLLPLKKQTHLPSFSFTNLLVGWGWGAGGWRGFSEGGRKWSGGPGGGSRSKRCRGDLPRGGISTGDVAMVCGAVGWRGVGGVSAQMPPKRTSTSEASAMTHAATGKLVADSVATALEAQATTMARTIGLIRWFKGIESVFSHSNYAEKNKVKFSINTLNEEALFW